jgi:hypothetical protein
MTNITSNSGRGAAISVAAVSVGLALLTSHDHLWVGSAWATLACVATVLAIRGSLDPAPALEELVRAIGADRGRPPVTLRATNVVS